MARRQDGDRTVIKQLLLAVVSGASLTSLSYAANPCENCATLNVPHKPFQIFGNTYYVGTNGLASILITSPHGDVLIDGDLPESVPQIVANIRSLGFNVGDIKLILNSHVHSDHAGGIAALQRMSGAMVKASPDSAAVLRTGEPGFSDPQHDIGRPFPAVPMVEVVADNEVLKVGAIAITAHFTPGHTPGGTTWTWDSCEKDRCFHMVYLDSLNAISSPAFKFSQNVTYPSVVSDFNKSFAVVSALPCDIALADHPEFTGLSGQLERREHGEKDALVDKDGCRRYVNNAHRLLEKRLASEKDR